LALENSTLQLSLRQKIDLEKKENSFSVTGEFEYAVDDYGLNLKTEVDAEKYILNEVKSQFVFAYPQPLKWSLTGTYFLDPEKTSKPEYLKTFGGQVAYETEDFETDLEVVQEKSKLTCRFGWFQELSARTQYGVDFTASVNDDPSVGLETSATTVAQFTWDENTKLKVKALVSKEEVKNSHARFVVAVAQRISKHAEFIISADFNGRHLFNTGTDGAPHSLGFQVNLQ